MSEFEEIRKLAPEERIRRLKELENGRKKEIEEAEALMKDSMIEIQDVQEKKHAPISQVKAHDISQLLTAEEKRMFRTARFEGQSGTAAVESEGQLNLEEVAAEEMPGGETQQKGGPIYGQKNGQEGAIYKGGMTTTGAVKEDDRKLYSGPGQQEHVHEFYKSETVTGAKPGGMYDRPEQQDVSETYVRKKEEEEKKKKFDFPW